MDKKCLLIGIIYLLSTCFVAANPERRTFQVDGWEREYLLYRPQHPQQEKAAGVIVCLHGFTRTMDDFFEEYDISAVADSLNLVIIAPQALPEQNNSVKAIAQTINLFTNDQISLNSVWGCGLSVRASLLGVSLLNEELNRDVDDVNFIDTLIDHILSEYTLLSENVFILGTSMGGYMAYQYAVKKGDRLSGLISVAGSMGLAIKGMDHAVKTPVCDFHSLTDEVVPYSGSYEQFPTTVSLAMNKTNVINYWTETNKTGTPTTEQVQYYPSTNGITVEKITYPEPVNEVIHYKINGAPHSYFFRKENSDCMDYPEEISRFIRSHLSGTTNHIPTITAQKLFVYPNPAKEELQVTSYELRGENYNIFSVTGQMLMQGKLQGETTTINVSTLANGVYLLRVSGKVEKFVKQ